MAIQPPLNPLYTRPTAAKIPQQPSWHVDTSLEPKKNCWKFCHFLPVWSVPLRGKHKIAKAPILIEIEDFFLFHTIHRVIVFRLLCINFEFPIITVCRTKNIKNLRIFQKKFVFKRIRKEWNSFTQKKTLQKTIILTYILKMRHQAAKPSRNFWGVASRKWHELQTYSVQERAWNFRLLSWRSVLG